MWFRTLRLSAAAQRRVYSAARSAGTVALVARNKRQTILAEARARAVQRAAAEEIGALTPRELRLIGSALYWAEGAKRQSAHGGKRVAFSNADPAAIALMMRFFRELCHVPEARFRAQLTVAPGIPLAPCLRFWSRVTGLPARAFIKTYNGLSGASQRKRPRHRLPYGTLQIRIADTQLFHRMLGWIAGVQSSARAPQAING